MKFFVETTKKDDELIFNLIKANTQNIVFSSNKVWKAQYMCNFLNYKPKANKEELANVLITLGVLGECYRDKNALAKMPKTYLLRQLERFCE